MFKAMILLTRRDDMTPDAFAEWLLAEHAPLAAQLAYASASRSEMPVTGRR